MLDMLRNELKEPTQRLVHLDLLRILAIYLVVFNHTGERGFMLFTTEMESPLYFLHMACSVICKIAVPIFFMISGALLLPREETLKRLFSKRVFRMAVVLFVISIPYYYWLHRSQGMGLSSFLTYIYGHCASTSLWYLYSYIGLLLLLPFLRSMVKGLKQRDYIYLIVGHIIFIGVIPCLEYCLWEGNVTLNESFSSVLFVSQNVFFALVGYYLEHVLDEKHYNRKTVIVSVVLSVASIMITCLMTYYQANKVALCTTEQNEAFFNSFICIPAMTVYFLVKKVSPKFHGLRVQRVMSALGAAVFGVYLIEKIIRALTSGAYKLLSPILGSFIAALVWCFVTCCVGFAIILSLKRIPVIKKLVNRFI